MCKYNLNIYSLKGSYAGAMGLGQFMPSSYLNYAVSFDGNKKIDLFTIKDAVVSVANYMNKHGWKKNQPVVEEYSIPNLKSLIAGSVTLGNKEIGVYHNFKVIKRYNNSNKYAMCVYLLSEAFYV